MQESVSYPVKSTALSIKILEVLIEKQDANLSELVEEMSIPTSTAHDHLVTLTQLGFIQKEGDRYQLSPRLLEFGGFARKQSQVFKIAEPELQKLARETGEHANLMIEENGFGLFLLNEKGENAVRLDTYEGKRVHLHSTAMGKSILAFMDEERVDKIIQEHGLPKFTDTTIGTKKALDEELAKIREQGYATDNQERIEGICCVASPIIGDKGGVAGAVSISAPASRMQGDFFHETLPEQVQSTTNVIEVNMRHH